uniref:Uncharacterized protein n=1 Tax=Escherichia coli TaxID=562 RepID=A0A6M9WTR8_ECOLX|nr:hypothetical protein HHJ25_02830 [Escherichia coli]
MPYIDITTMRGMMPRVVTSMLPEHSAVLAEDCHFRFGVITPERQISGVPLFRTETFRLILRVT